VGRDSFYAVSRFINKSISSPCSLRLSAKSCTQSRLPRSPFRFTRNFTKKVTAPKNDGTAATEQRNRTWTYNALGQVLTAKDPLNKTTTTYDSITATLGGPGGKGRITRISDATGRVDYVYNLSGRLTSKTTVLTGATNPNDVVSYAYNASGQMTAMTTPSGQTLTYVYGAPTSSNPGKVTGIQV
jgi:YD repeat-containing protein